MHPVTVLAVNALATNLNLNLGNNLLSREVQPTGIDASVVLRSIVSSVTHELVDLGKCNLKICARSKISVSTDGTLNSSSKISLSIECLFNRFNSKVSVSAVCDFPESNLRITCTFPLPYFSIRIRLYLMMNLFFVSLNLN